MNYSTHFGEAVRSIGVPNLNQKQFAHLMNIVVLESEIKGMNDAHSYFKENEALKFMTQRKVEELRKLTYDKSPELVLQDILDLALSEK